MAGGEPVKSLIWPHAAENCVFSLTVAESCVLLLPIGRLSRPSGEFQMSLAYRADPAVTKPAFLDVLLGHQEADRIVQGRYWEHGKGCAVGCGIHSVMALTGREMSHSDHAALAGALGANETLMRLQDRIFEGLPADEARLWPVRFARAIPDGADLSGVKALEP